MHIIIIGPPGSGKGTQAKKMAEKYDLKHISTGDLLRNELNKNTTNGQKIAKILAEGKLVPDELINELIKPYLSSSILLDGYPRTLTQAKRIDFEIDLVIYLYADFEECVRRIAQRNQGRVDDNENTARDRIKVYMESTKPVVDFYDEQNKLHKIDGEQSIENIFTEICELIDKLR